MATVEQCHVNKQPQMHRLNIRASNYATLQHNATYANETEVRRVLAQLAGVVKFALGIANNAAYYCYRDAMDQIRRHPNYRNNIKQEFKKVEKEWADYEAHLLHNENNRFFHVDDMGPEIRKKYHDGMTDREYFEWWQATGADAYSKKSPFVKSMANKYRKSLALHGGRHPDIIGWGMVTECMLQYAEKTYQSTMKQIINVSGIPKQIMFPIFDCFRLNRIEKAWYRALSMLEPLAASDISPEEQRDINLGLQDIEEQFFDVNAMFDSMQGAVEDYAEVFATKGYQKKALREIAENRADVNSALTQH